MATKVILLIPVKLNGIKREMYRFTLTFDNGTPLQEVQNDVLEWTNLVANEVREKGHVVDLAQVQQQMFVEQQAPPPPPAVMMSVASVASGMQ